MRPVGDVRQALLAACIELATPTQGPTLRELAAKACVGLDAARRTVSDMSRANQIHKVRTRRVQYRNRPVAEYAPAGPECPQGGGAELASVLQAWGG